MTVLQKSDGGSRHADRVRERPVLGAKRTTLAVRAHRGKKPGKKPLIPQKKKGRIKEILFYHRNIRQRGKGSQRQPFRGNTPVSRKKEEEKRGTRGQESGRRPGDIKGEPRSSQDPDSASEKTNRGFRRLAFHQENDKVKEEKRQAEFEIRKDGKRDPENAKLIYRERRRRDKKRP